MTDDRDFASLEGFLSRVPSVTGAIGKGRLDDGNWWVKFSLDLEHRLAWHVVQELGHVLNHLSLNERLPTVFMPVSSAPYLNGGPREYLGWVIESKTPSFKPAHCAKWLEERLPNPVHDEASWPKDGDG
jgi:hypothetical protein